MWQMIAVESSPPDKEIPTGTSLRVRSLTASANVSKKTFGGSAGARLACGGKAQ